MSKVVACKFMGRFGNNMFQYAFARAYAEKHGYEFQCDPWDGHRIFKLDDKPFVAHIEERRDENNLKDGEYNIIIRSYCQQQKCLIYTKRDCLRWFQFQDWVHEALADQVMSYRHVGHRRVGDYVGYGYPIVHPASYLEKFTELGVARFAILNEEHALKNPKVPESLSWLPDFYTMVYADTLLRGNSSFSWWAATLSRHGRIFCPDMTGCKGGVESDVPFVEGNHKSFNPMLDFVTDLHLQP